MPLLVLSRHCSLHTAIRRNDAKKVMYILSDNTQPLTVQHFKTAITNASYAALQALLHTFQAPVSKSGTLTTACASPETLTHAIYAAAAALDPVAINILISSGASPRANQKGLEPVHAAIHSKAKTHIEKQALSDTIITLMSKGALEGHFEEEQYPPNYAIAHRNHSALSTLLTHPSQSLSSSLYKYSTVRYACTHASIQALSTLLPHINTTHADTYGSTPLHHAVSSPHAPESTIQTMVQMILHAGCHVGKRDMYGRTPLQIARTRGMYHVVDVLADAGASGETFCQVLLRREERDARKRAARIVKEGNVVAVTAGQCSICLDPLSAKRAVKMSCGHIHHTDCLSTWVLTTPSCPLCKKPLG